MEWYIPITILPGIGMLIFSTTGQMIAISGEVGDLLSNKCTDFQHMIADLKIIQIKRLTYASTLLYVAAGAYVLSGILGALLSSIDIIIPDIFLVVGTVSMFVALILLIKYAFNTIKIRQLQFDNNHNL